MSVYDRDILIDLMTEFFGCDPQYYGVDAYELADFLVANGVTVSEYVPFVCLPNTPPIQKGK